MRQSSTFWVCSIFHLYFLVGTCLHIEKILRAVFQRLKISFWYSICQLFLVSSRVKANILSPKPFYEDTVNLIWYIYTLSKKCFWPWSFRKFLKACGALSWRFLFAVNIICYNFFMLKNVSSSVLELVFSACESDFMTPCVVFAMIFGFLFFGFYLLNFIYKPVLFIEFSSSSFFNHTSWDFLMSSYRRHFLESDWPVVQKHTLALFFQWGLVLGNGIPSVNLHLLVLNE